MPYGFKNRPKLARVCPKSTALTVLLRFTSPLKNTRTSTVLVSLAVLGSVTTNSNFSVASFVATVREAARTHHAG